MLDKQTRTLIAQRLNQAEKQREQIRAISLDYPSITIGGRLRRPARVGRDEDRRRPRAQRPQDRPDL